MANTAQKQNKSIKPLVLDGINKIMSFTFVWSEAICRRKIEQNHKSWFELVVFVVANASITCWETGSYRLDIKERWLRWTDHRDMTLEVETSVKLPKQTKKKTMQGL